MIVNLDESDELGSHWVLLYLKPGRNIYFDSYGKPPNTAIKQWLEDQDQPIQSNTVQIQGYGTDYCGLYVLFFYYYLARGWDLQRILCYFNRKNLKANDTFLINWTLDVFGVNVKNLINTNAE